METKKNESKKQRIRKVIKKDKKRYKTPEIPEEIREIIGKKVHERPPFVGDRICEVASDRLNAALNRGCILKNHFVIESDKPCAKGGGETAPVDLVVVIDTSGSMTDEAKDLSTEAEAAIQAAKKSCPSDLRVAWFGIEGTFTQLDANTKFTQTYREYLLNLGVPVSDIVGTPGDFEDGAAAIMDISDHFDWRPGAARDIFYLGDEALEGGDPQNADDVTAANSAIATANAKNVTVFTYFGTNYSVDATTASEYARVASETGGNSFSAPAANLGGFKTILEQIICASGNGGCYPIQAPKIQPCFTLRWGDSPDDRIETDDIEVVCLTACNPYSNLIIKNLDVLVSIITDADGTSVAQLPDNSPSVQIKPTYLINFGDIPPCDPKNPDKPSCVSREFVLISRGAKEGKYLLNIIYCFSAEFTIADLSKFEIELVKS